MRLPLRLRRRGYPERRPVEVDLRDTACRARPASWNVLNEAQQAAASVGRPRGRRRRAEDLEQGAAAQAARSAARPTRRKRRPSRAAARGPGQRAPRGARAEREARAAALRAEQESQARRRSNAPVMGRSLRAPDGSTTTSRASSSGDELAAAPVTTFDPEEGAFWAGRLREGREV